MVTATSTSPRAARQAVEWINAVRRETLPFVLRIKPEAADDFVLEPEEARAGQVAHRGSENAVVERGAAGVSVHGKLDFIGRIAALRDNQAHSRAVVEGLDPHGDVELLHAGRWL